ncbi:AbrB family transcriptional regulator [Aquibacillus halophilus]|uniref:AbrB family transcriptional regulator n=1 Tax=Aquibacillus halophilus TaxID=930132 RepID=UPI00129AFA03|nr:AbrB family transcriptional regulator [Aquibacillus halophilus]
MLRKSIFLTAAFALGYVFSIFHVPAGWLIGAVVVGIFYRFVIGELSFHSFYFDISLALIGVSIGLTIQFEMFRAITSYIVPLILSMFAILIGAWVLGKILYHYSNLDKKTALFCCVPTGVSIMIGLSNDYKADTNVVAAFQTTRVLLFVSTMPILAGIMSSLFVEESTSTTTNQLEQTIAMPFPGAEFVIYTTLIVITLGLAFIWKIPVASFLYGLIVGFVWNQFVYEVPPMPNLFIGVGMVILGVMIGLKFDKQSLVQLKQIGRISVIVLGLNFALVFAVSYMFYMFTDVGYFTSLLSVVPAGAPQMASIAAVIGLDATVVSSMQIIRLLAVVVLIPTVIPFLVDKPVKQRNL